MPNGQLYELCAYCDPEGEEYNALKENDIGVVAHTLCSDHGLQIDAESQMLAHMGVNGELGRLSTETRQKMFPMLFGNGKENGRDVGF